ncbi:MAG: DUF4823 domain-containing protein [Pseudomonadales bacterium]
MLRYGRLLFSSILGVFLLACTPSHTVETTESYARNIGVINQFHIHRWHARSISRDSRIFVVASDSNTNVKTNGDSNTLADVVARSLSPYFSHVSPVEKQLSITTANRLARDRRYHFLIYIDFIDSSRAAINFDEDKADEKKTNYKHLELILTVVDVVSEQTIDKIKISANKSVLNLIGTDMQSLLAKPIDRIGQDLTGV